MTNRPPRDGWKQSGRSASLCAALAAAMSLSAQPGCLLPVDLGPGDGDPGDDAGWWDSGSGSLDVGTLDAGGFDGGDGGKADAGDAGDAGDGVECLPPADAGECGRITYWNAFSGSSGLIRPCQIVGQTLTCTQDGCECSSYNGSGPRSLPAPADFRRETLLALWTCRCGFAPASTEFACDTGAPAPDAGVPLYSLPLGAECSSGEECSSGVCFHSAWKLCTTLCPEFSQCPCGYTCRQFYPSPDGYACLP